MLNFFGSGGAFNTERGNNSAYLKHGRNLIIFDVGGDVLPKMVDQNIFEGIARIHIFISHMHGDHVGGLGNTLLYLNSEVLRQQPENICVYFPGPVIETFLYMQGVERDKKYTLFAKSKDKLFLIGESDIEAEYSFEKTTHTPVLGKDTYGIDLTLGKAIRIFYSGDTNRFNPKCLNIDDYTAVYHEISSDPGTVEHFQYKDLLKLTDCFTLEQRNKIHLMHISKDFDTECARLDGFSVVENIEKKIIE